MALQLLVDASTPAITFARVLRRYEVRLLLRDHEAGAGALYERGRRLHEEAPGVPVIVSDRLDVALALGAEGVHLSSRSLSPEAVRRLYAGPMGRSVHSVDEGRRLGPRVDYLVLGAVWETPSHPERRPLGLPALAELAAMGIPIFGIGGVTPERYRRMLAVGAAGAVVASAIWSAEDPGKAVEAFFSADDIQQKEDGTP